MHSNNPWDLLSSKFEEKQDESEIDVGAADNILIAWPEILQFIRDHIPPKANKRLLEFGCGGGGFAHKLTQLGFNVTAIDSSKQMIANAKSAFGDQIEFECADSSVLANYRSFSIVTSVMTFQFIENIEKTFIDIVNVLDVEGIFVFAVHNPAHVAECLHANVPFYNNFDSIEEPRKGFMEWDGNSIPLYLRTAEEYNAMINKMGLEPLFTSYPPYTKEFLAKYSIDGPTKESEFLILGYKKR